MQRRWRWWRGGVVRRRRRGGGGAAIQPGTYTAKVVVNGTTYIKPFEVLEDKGSRRADRVT
jgi:hypothetical protein